MRSVLRGGGTGEQRRRANSDSERRCRERRHRCSPAVMGRTGGTANEHSTRSDRFIAAARNAACRRSRRGLGAAGRTATGSVDGAISRQKWQATACPSSSVSGGDLLGAALARVRAARAEAAARRRSRRVRNVALQHHAARASAPGSGTGIDGEQRLRVRDGAARANSARLSARSTMRPRYITATRVAMCLTTARSCAMNRYDSPKRACSSREQVDRPAPGSRRRAPTPARRRRSAAARPRARARCRCAAAGRPRTRADSGARARGARPTSPSTSATRSRCRPSREPVQRQRLLEHLADGHARIERARTGPGR